jgi:ketosteroid isomerase-like protein
MWDYSQFEACDPFFRIVLEGLSDKVTGPHFFDAIAEDAVFEFRYEFPDWPTVTRSRDELIEQFVGYGDNIRIHSSDGLVVHRCDCGDVLILEYQVHGTILRTKRPYNNRFISVVTVKDKKIVHWVDYMDSLAAWNALTAD